MERGFGDTSYPFAVLRQSVLNAACFGSIPINITAFTQDTTTHNAQFIIHNAEILCNRQRASNIFSSSNRRRSARFGNDEQPLLQYAILFHTFLPARLLVLRKKLPYSLSHRLASPQPIPLFLANPRNFENKSEPVRRIMPINVETNEKAANAGRESVHTRPPGNGKRIQSRQQGEWRIRRIMPRREGRDRQNDVLEGGGAAWNQVPQDKHVQKSRPLSPVQRDLEAALDRPPPASRSRHFRTHHA